MKIASIIKYYVLPITCGVALFIAFFSFFHKEAIAAPLTGANSDVDIYIHEVFGNWTVDTTDANDSDSIGDVDWPANGTRTAYIGVTSGKFNKIFFDVSSAILGGENALQLQYWNGSWTDLSLDAGSNPLYSTGIGSVSFSAPADWITSSTYYYVRTKPNASGFAGAGINQISVQTVTPPGVTVSEIGIGTVLVEGGGTDQYTIVLNAAPLSNVNIAVSADANSSVSTSSITFTSSNWSDPVTVTINPVDDSIAEGTHRSTITHTATSADAGYNGISINSVVATVTDNDTAGVTVTQTDISTSVTEGGTTGNVALVLTSSPTSTVTLTLTPTDQITLSTSSIEFSSANWNIPVTSTITAVDDARVEGTHTATLTYTVASSNWNYSGLSVSSTTVTITDNDSDTPATSPSRSNSPAVTPAPPVLPSADTNNDSAVFVPVAQEVVLQGEKPVAVTVSGENHTVTQVGSATDSQITVVVRSEPIIITLAKNEIQEVDVNKDGKKDLRLQYKGLSNGQPRMEITALTEAGENTKAVSINNGAAFTLSRSVTVTLRAYHAEWMAISEDPSFKNASFVPYQQNSAFTLSEGPGEKVLYVRFRSGSGGTVEANDRITLTQKESCPLMAGRAYKSPESSAVYLILDTKEGETGVTDAPCVKRLFHDPSTYFTYFSSYNDIVGTTQTLLNSIPNDSISLIPLGSKASLQEKSIVKQTTNANVYILLSKKLHWVKTEEVFQKMGLMWGSVRDISRALFSQFSEGTPLENAPVDTKN